MGGYISERLENMIPAPAGVAAPIAIFTSEDGILLAYGITVPSDAAVGYAPGCLFIDVDGTTTSKLYCNIGTKASANFNLVTVAAD
jgi:hypothetical protein